MITREVCVIGGGPAGLAAAIMARQRGLSAIVLDGSSPPVDKACGEGLMPDARHEAARLGIRLPESAGFEFRGIRFYGAERSVEADFQRGKGIGVRRMVLHQAMIEAAVEAGVELRWNTPVANFDEIRQSGLSGQMDRDPACGSGRSLLRQRGIPGDLDTGSIFGCLRGRTAWRFTGVRGVRSM